MIHTKKFLRKGIRNEPQKGPFTPFPFIQRVSPSFPHETLFDPPRTIKHGRVIIHTLAVCVGSDGFKGEGIEARSHAFKDLVWHSTSSK